ncbi:MAG TPA: hypothetical protein VHV79_12695 [Mycobacteriales bacterium]|nr:hypothetical protein [Mycobacteriales bacterium]
MSDDHLSLNELAELDEDLLPPERAAAARSHLDGCAQCQAGAESITVTRTALGELPAVTMPAEVQARLEQALADEATGPARSTTIVPNVVDLPRRRFGRPTMAASAAAAAVVLIIGAIVVAKVDHHSNGAGSGDAGTSAAGALAQVPSNQVGNPNFPTSTSGVTYTPTSLPADVEDLLNTAGHASAGPAGVPATTLPVPTATASHKASAPSTTSSGTHLGGKPKPKSSGGHFSAATEGIVKAPATLPAALRPLAASRTSLLACAEHLAPAVGTFPIAIDFARWTAPAIGTTPAVRDAPSLIVVFPYSGNTYLVDIVAPACDDSSIRQFQQVTLPN